MKYNEIEDFPNNKKIMHKGKQNMKINLNSVNRKLFISIFILARANGAEHGAEITGHNPIKMELEWHP